MDYIKIRFASDFDRLSSEIEKTCEDLFCSLSPTFTLTERIWRPPMDIYETETEIIIRAEIAGVDKENLEVEISSRAVKIYGNRTETPCAENATYRLAEIQYGRFQRTLFLPSPIDTDIVSSAYHDGFLEIRLTKLPTDKTHKIAILDG